MQVQIKYKFMENYLLSHNTQYRYKAHMNEAKVILSWGGNWKVTWANTIEHNENS